MPRGDGAPTVLVVDDDEDIRDAMRDALERRAFHVVHAHNGADAFVALNSVQVDLIVLDLAMPELDGWAFLRRRATDARLVDIPVLVVTASRDAAASHDGRIQRVLRKPFGRAELVEMVSELTSARIHAAS